MQQPSLFKNRIGLSPRRVGFWESSGDAVRRKYCCVRRPELLMREAFAGVVPALQKLRDLFPGADIQRVVERQPYLLLAHCDQLIQEMQGYAPKP